MIGIDLIDIKQMPEFDSKKEKRFFYDNFSKNELTVIKNSRNQRTTAALLFSLKESILKCDNSYIDFPFKSINIVLKKSLAFHPKFFLSYSILKNDTIVTIALARNYNVI
jgi:phosphopantetheine--protein transferase-like protein